MGAPQIDGFSFETRLGRGGFSDVYLYRQQLPSRQVAIKVLNRDALDDHVRRQFTAEANLMARVSTHPAICTVYSAGIEANGLPYLVMEYCSGGSLGARFRHEQISVEQVLAIGVRMAAALETAHRAGIVHRDVKPANILLNDYGSTVLTDFGISAISSDFPDATQFREQAYATQSPVDDSPESLGMSIPWSAPETFDDDPNIDNRSDVFSLAATLYSLLEGRTPFEKSDAPNRAASIMARIQAGARQPFSRTDIPNALVEAIDICLQHDPSHRYQSSLEFAERLQHVEAELGLALTPIETTDVPVSESDMQTRRRVESPPELRQEKDHPVERARTSDARGSRPRKRRRLAIAAASVTAIAVIAVAAAIGVPRALSAGHEPTASPSVHASENAAATLAPFIDGLTVTSSDDDVTVTFPDDQAPPDELAGKVVDRGTSSEVVGPDSTIGFSYVTSDWLLDETAQLTFPEPGASAGSPTSVSDLEVALGVELLGLPEGSVIVTTGPPGLYLYLGPFTDAQFSTQVVVIRLDSVT